MKNNYFSLSFIYGITLAAAAIRNQNYDLPSHSTFTEEFDASKNSIGVSSNCDKWTGPLDIDGMQLCPEITYKLPWSQMGCAQAQTTSFEATKSSEKVAIKRLVAALLANDAKAVNAIAPKLHLRFCRSIKVDETGKVIDSYLLGVTEIGYRKYNGAFFLSRETPGVWPIAIESPHDGSDGTSQSTKILFAQNPKWKILISNGQSKGLGDKQIKCERKRKNSDMSHSSGHGGHDAHVGLMMLTSTPLDYISEIRTKIMDSYTADANTPFNVTAALSYLSDTEITTLANAIQPTNKLDFATTVEFLMSREYENYASSPAAQNLLGTMIFHLHGKRNPGMIITNGVRSRTNPDSLLSAFTRAVKNRMPDSNANQVCAEGTPLPNKSTCRIAQTWVQVRHATCGNQCSRRGTNLDRVIAIELGTNLVDSPEVLNSIVNSMEPYITARIGKLPKTCDSTASQEEYSEIADKFRPVNRTAINATL